MILTILKIWSAIMGTLGVLALLAAWALIVYSLLYCARSLWALVTQRLGGVR